MSKDIILSNFCLKNNLAPLLFQDELLQEYLISRSHRIYNGCEPGLGKSPQFFMWANTLQAKQVLIVSPPCMRLPWGKFAKEWFKAPAFNKDGSCGAVISSKKDLAVLLESHKGKGRVHGRAHIPPSPLIISYNMLTTNSERRDKDTGELISKNETGKELIDYIMSYPWDVICGDEITECRNIFNARTNIFKDIVDANDYYMPMSGTPVWKSAADLFPVLYNIVPGLSYVSREHRDLCCDFQAFVEKFTFINNGAYGTTYKGIRNLPLLKEILRGYDFFYRKTKAEVWPDLPEITWTQVDLNLSVGEEDDISELVDSYVEGGDLGGLGDDPIYAVYRRELGTHFANSKDTKDFIEQFLIAGESVVVFTWHRDVTELLLKKFASYKPRALYGGTANAAVRNDTIEAFQAGEFPILINQYKSGGIGITLNIAYTGICVELPDTAADLQQAAKRMDRIPYKNAISMYLLTAKNEFHQKLVGKIISMQRGFDRLIEDPVEA